MNKYKCNHENCDHQSPEAGYCPKHGEKLVELGNNQPETGNEVKEFLAQVEKTVKDTMEKYQVKSPEVHPSNTPNSYGEKLEFVKGLLSDSDKATYAAKRSDEDKEKFLGKCQAAYLFKHLAHYQITKDPEHLAKVKALATGVDADGGYLVPTQFRAELIEDLQDKGFLRSYVTVIPMTSNSMEIPTLLSSVKTSWGSENTPISTTTARFGTLTFTPYRLNTFIYASRELLADSALSIVPLLTRLMREAIGRAEDTAIVNGSGSGQPKGIFQETLAGIDNGNDDSTLAPNIKKLPFRLGTAYRVNARWLMNSRSREHISALRDSQNQFLFKEGIEGKTPDTLAGYPVHEQNDMPLDTLLFADLSQYYLGDREQVSVETTTEGAGTFEKHQIAIKVIERIDGKVAQTNAFKTITNAGID